MRSEFQGDDTKPLTERPSIDDASDFTKNQVSALANQRVQLYLYFARCANAYATM
jgi:hypothetical protein